MYKFIKAELTLNALSLLNVISGFLFIIFFGQRFGFNESTDAYFSALTVLIATLPLSQMTWEAITPFYISLRNKSENQSNNLYFYFLLAVVFVSIVVVLLYFLVKDYFSIGTNSYSDFFDIYVFFYIVKSVLLYNNVILNLNSFFHVQYITDLTINTILLVGALLLPKSNYLIPLAYMIIITGVFAIFYQLYYISKTITNFRRKKINRKLLKVIFFKSVILKSGSILYGMKDFIVMSFFLGLSEGLYSMYSFSYRLASALHRIASAPVLNIFITKINKVVALKNHKIKGVVNHEIKHLLIKSLLLFLIGGVIVYLMIPLIINLANINSFPDGNSLFEKYFLFSFVHYLIIVIFFPYHHFIIAIKKFSIIFNAHLLFILCFYLSFLISSNEIELLFGLIFSQLILGVYLMLSFKRYS